MADNLEGVRVLVVGINYAPEHTGIAPYTTQACEYLAEQGAVVSVLAGTPHYPHWTTPAAYRRRLVVDEERGGVAIRRIRHVVPTRQTGTTRGAYELSFGAHVLVRAPRSRPDLVLTVVPSLAGAVAATRLAARWNCPSLVWVQDLMAPAAAHSGIAGGAKLSRGAAQLERYVLRRAAAVLVLNESFKRYAETMGVDPARVHLVPNWTHVTPPSGRRQEMRDRFGWSSECFIALHSGNMGLKQDLENVVAAAKLAADDAPNVHFVLMGDGSQRERLLEQGRGLQNLHFLEPVSAEDYPDVLSAADVLVINERPAAVDMSLPSKLTSYLGAGMPVIAAAPPGGGTALEVLRSGAGFVVAPGQPNALLHAVAGLSTRPEQLVSLRAAASSFSNAELDATAALQQIRDVVGKLCNSWTGSGVTLRSRPAD